MTATCPSGEIVERVEAAPAPAPATKAAEPIEELSGGGQAWVLDPAKVPSWHSSSFDLLTGLTVRDVSDTLPARIFEEVFKSDRRLMRRKDY
jgi:hypothetical protein